MAQVGAHRPPPISSIFRSWLMAVEVRWVLSLLCGGRLCHYFDSKASTHWSPSNPPKQRKMAGEEDQHDLGLSLGGLYRGNSGGALMAPTVSVGVNVTEVAAAPSPRAVSLPSVRELEMMRVSEVQFLSRAMATSLRLTIQEEKAKKAPAAAARLPEVAALGVNVTGSGRLAATSSTVSSELKSGEGSSNQPVVTTTMMANTKKVKADDPEQDSAAKRARVYHRNVVRPIRREGMVRMPSVKTIGADGKKVEGYLYKYLEGKVRIVCACHGTFQSPAEFVKHAGGNEIANPLKQITVSLD